MAVTYTTILTAAALALLSGTAHSHMIMNTPTPYNLHGSAKLLQVDPLGPSYPFPCQGLTDAVSAATPLTAGASQLVNFTGGAQHGGGSCQFSLTYEYPPPADKTKWKTIYTLIGGCPVSAVGNLPKTGTDQDSRADALHCGNDSGTECIRQFDVPIPKALPNGNATFAWTWFNKIGDREVYMNCAPVSITGGADEKGFFEALPQMFLANVPGECTTGGGVLNIPNPGKYGKVLEQPAPGSEGSCPKAEGVPVFENGGSSSSPPPSESLVVIPITSTGAATSSSASLVVIPITTPLSTAASGFVTQTTTDVAAPVPTATAGSGSGSGSGSSGSQPCSANGAIVCFSPTSFGLCANGAAIPQPVAAGTTCTSGQIVRRSAKFVFW
ncbi:hypothetical protein C8A00DRAFT_37919 [Chaetomidium leptoderma]|uniref:Lytic polysaccharide monooxygenase n=1 Tax=Chaetomidium leptoderma TaxID=669021 RepID=A0AAN6VG04_9PEZI|nr:hypothetical protein C8A00DRAFT_37919 [Chaetomidium leptoderma]